MPRPEIQRIDTYSGRTGTELRERRKRKGWTRGELAISLTKHGYPIAESTLQSYENGHRPIPINALPYFAEVFKVRIFRLLPPS